MTPALITALVCWTTSGLERRVFTVDRASRGRVLITLTQGDAAPVTVEGASMETALLRAALWAYEEAVR